MGILKLMDVLRDHGTIHNKDIKDHSGMETENNRNILHFIVVVIKKTLKTVLTKSEPLGVSTKWFLGFLTLEQATYSFDQPSRFSQIHSKIFKNV
jgi:hypothetical protein